MIDLKSFREDNNIKQSEICKILGIAQSYVSAIESRRRPLNEEKFKLLYEHYGDIILKYKQPDNVIIIKSSEAEPVTEIITKRVPLVNQYAYAGYLTGYQDQEYIDQLPTVLFDVDHDPKGNYLAFEVKGDSMNDGSDESYKDGDRLLCREIPSHLWCNSKLHLRKWDFVIVHKEGVLVKRIVDHDVQNHTITIHSLNPFYEDQVIDLVV
jgi:transcriptional regulator with XRE-family HTH domain